MLPHLSGDTPFQRYFQLDFRRRWTPRRLLGMAFVLLAILALQTTVTWLVLQPAFGRSPFGIRVAAVCSHLQLINQLGFLFVDDFKQYSQRDALRAWLAIGGVLAPVFALVMPAALASSIAAERELMRLEEVRLTRLTPGEILLAKGLSCALPFVLLALAYAVVDVLTLFLVRAPAMQDARMPEPVQNLMQGGATEFARKLYVFSLYVGAVLAPVMLLVRAAILVCASALCRRVTTALTVGFGIVLVAEPLVGSAITWGLAMFTPPERGIRSLLGTALSLLLYCIALRLLLPHAIRAIEPAEFSELMGDDPTTTIA